MITLGDCIEYKNSIFTFKQTKELHTLKVFYNATSIGYLIQTEDTFRIKKNDIFEEPDSYSTVEDLLLCPRIPFKYVIVKHWDTKLKTTREKFIRLGKREEYFWGWEISLPVEAFNMNMTEGD